MIGRKGPVDHFELIRWARRMASACDLKPVEAHVLLVLATYANAECEAWPAVKTLARACGRTPSKRGTCSAISDALGELQARELIWTTQGGHGRTAKRELLFDPAIPMKPAPGWEIDLAPQPSRIEESKLERSGEQAIPDTGCEPSSIRDTEEPEKHHQEPEMKNQESHPLSRMASPPVSGRVSESIPDEERQRVRLAIVKSLESAA